MNKWFETLSTGPPWSSGAVVNAARLTQLNLGIQMFDDSIVNSLKDEHYSLQQRMSSQSGLVLVLMIQCSCFIDCVFLCCSAGWTRPRKSSGRSAVRPVSFSFSTCDQSGRWWVGLCDSHSLALSFLSHICRFNNCNYQSAGVTHTGWTESGFLIHTAFWNTWTILMRAVSWPLLFCVQNDMLRMQRIDQNL